MFIDEYNKNPKLCLFCGKKIPYKKRENTYCNSSCFAKKTNRTRKTILEKRLCPECHKVISGKNAKKKKFCSLICFGNNLKRLHTEKNLNAFCLGKMGDERARKFFRKINENNKKCSICGLKNWMGKEIPLEVDHIDGNSENNFPENLRFVCCNCAAQLPTYKSLNRGNGRKSRRGKW